MPSRTVSVARTGTVSKRGKLTTSVLSPPSPMPQRALGPAPKLRLSMSASPGSIRAGPHTSIVASNVTSSALRPHPPRVQTRATSGRHIWRSACVTSASSLDTCRRRTALQFAGIISSTRRPNPLASCSPNSPMARTLTNLLATSSRSLSPSLSFPEPASWFDLGAVDTGEGTSATKKGACGPGEASPRPPPSKSAGTSVPAGRTPGLAGSSSKASAPRMESSRELIWRPVDTATSDPPRHSRDAR
mmetsp:Transcript_19827/g.64467  ORF Transcript_19827/g.64467 Transcript_19827/m.64467 type:complete len:246 (+) Transcript_19827:165-902(+)